MVLERRDVDPDKLQLVGITAMLVASKLEEYYPADIKKLLHLTENSFNLRDVLEMELVMIDVLDFQVFISQIISVVVIFNLYLALHT